MGVLGLIERAAAISQGKGFGSHTTKTEVARAISLLGRKPSLSVDVGGNKGEYAQSLLTANPQAEIHIFEPSSTNIDHLRNRFSGNTKIAINGFGLGSANDTGVLYADAAGSGLASLTKRKLDHFGIDFEHTENVEVRRFDEYWETTLERRSVDLVKIDVEGHELDVLSGFGDVINHIDIIQFEFGGCNVDTRSYFRDFWYFFSGNGFKIFRITPIGISLVNKYRELDECFVTTNYLARRRS
jgi:FkbM family methyltransferase